MKLLEDERVADILSVPKMVPSCACWGKVVAILGRTLKYYCRSPERLKDKSSSDLALFRPIDAKISPYILHSTGLDDAHQYVGGYGRLAR